MIAQSGGRCSALRDISLFTAYINPTCPCQYHRKLRESLRVLPAAGSYNFAQLRLPKAPLPLSETRVVDETLTIRREDKAWNRQN
jgi:hypothetical protein